MTKPKIPDSFFENQDFDSIDDSLAVGILGPNASEKQKKLYQELQTIRTAIIDKSLSAKELNLSEDKYKRILNLQIDVLTKDELETIKKILFN